MTDTQISEGLMTIEEFIAEFDKHPFELINGERKILSPTMFDHGDVQSSLMTALTMFVTPRNLGKIFLDTPFVLAYERKWVKGSRVPDLMYFEASRLTAYKASDPDYGHKPPVLVPDLIVEIVSPTDRFTDVYAKVAAYLRDGVRLIWIIDLQRKLVIVFQKDKPEISLSGDDKLTGGDVIPGFEVTVRTLFE